MKCADVQAALSARLDGEPFDAPDDVIDAHLSECAECTAFFQAAASLNRQLSLQPAPPAVPDLAPVILSTIEPEFRRQARARATWVTGCRVMLVVLGLLFVWSGLAALTTPAPGAEALALDAAAVRMTLAFGALFAAWRPDAMAALAPMYGALCAFSVGLRLRDIIFGTITGGEVWFLVLAGACAVTLIAGWLGRSGVVLLRSTWKTLNAVPLESR
ncbi:hypothetical protein C1Y63_01400 [Corynebacterium sp. 13CS0277]|uniref:zf-HC2 domain-containing protein n=1 Tax=Corynebacterium sp. 13CS0277 TaxID=2071994 RepID=UPI000D02D147|nr:zf-HC2 domain-containing protein [Corynebacterium sp. 13CS0277]PRQ12475.1 hypothetical protein C1Y63_01400 [Corynebacterium sp. 13CS0277]